ncbi:MAG: CBS domain-containing protein [Deltaproteobacteria bacterium]|jgi:CBS domain-containing protein
MAISQYMETKVICCPPNATLSQTAKLMKTNNVGAIIVQKNGKPQGMVTDRDLTIKAMALGKNIDSTLVSEVMTRPVISAKAQEGVYEVISKMKKAKIRRMPVVDDSGKVVGIISFGDIVGLLSDEFSHLSQAVLPHRGSSTMKRAA